MYRANPLNFQDVPWINRPLSETFSSFGSIAFRHRDSHIMRHKIGTSSLIQFVFARFDVDFATISDNLNFLYRPIHFRKNRRFFRLPHFKKLLHARQTLCDIFSGNTNSPGMESTHGQLCSWLTNRLCCNNANRFADVHQASRGKIPSITFYTNTISSLTSENRSYPCTPNVSFLEAYDYLLIDFFSCSH